MNKYFCGIDLGVRSSSICIIDENKKIVQRWQGRTSSIAKEIGKRAGKIHCVIEAGPLAESICVAVEGVGASIEIIDSRHTKALLHGNKNRKV